MKRQRSHIGHNGLLISAMVCLFANSLPACPPPPCPPCYGRVGDNCVWLCTGEQVCCQGSCCTNACCDEKTCYNYNTHRCCNQGTGHICAIGKSCCGENCCDYPYCCDQKTCLNAEIGEHCCHYGNGVFCPDGIDCCNGGCCTQDAPRCCAGKTCYNLNTHQCCDDGIINSGVGTVCKKSCCDKWECEYCLVLAGIDPPIVTYTCASCLRKASYARLQECNRVPDPDFVPTPNGCGPEGGFPPVPENPSGCEGASFSPACDMHDLCWGTCGSDKAQCDSEFLRAMLEICDNSSCPYLCSQFAYLYYEAVSTYGNSNYQSAQEAACACCDC